MLIGLCGCMMQEPEVGRKAEKSYRFVDLIFGTHNIFKFAELIYTRLKSEPDGDRYLKDTDTDRRGAAGGAKISVQIRCQYYVWMQQFLQLLYRSICPRDESGSREPKDIIREIERLGCRWSCGSYASWTERQFIWKESGAADDLCTL